MTEDTHCVRVRVRVFMVSQLGDNCLARRSRAKREIRVPVIPQRCV